MKHFLLTTLAIFIFVPFGIAQSPTASPSPTTVARTNLEQEFKSILQKMADAAWSLNETAAESKIIAERTLADTYVQVFENGDMMTKAEIVQARTPEAASANAEFAAETKYTIRIEDVRAELYGDAASVNYLLIMRLVFNDEPVVKTYRCTETFIRKDNRWQSVLHTETAMPGEPVAAKINTKVYDDYVGQYRLTSTIIYKVSRGGGDKLIWGNNKRELVPENENTFVLKRDKTKKVDEDNSYRIIFVRDDNGKITHLRLREFPGVEYNAIKIK